MGGGGGGAQIDSLRKWLLVSTEEGYIVRSHTSRFTHAYMVHGTEVDISDVDGRGVATVYPN